jgi:amidase
MSTFTDRTQVGTAGITVAVKDIIDMEGFVTTAGCRAIERSSSPAAVDAPCLAGLRAATRAGEARMIGRTNLDELAVGASGVNHWFGTPVNPLDPARIPGGSSSGSGAAVAAGEAEVAFGTDTGGSVRIPAACCGVVGLKTSYGRVSTEGVVPLSQTLDTVGPIGADIARVGRGMALLEPGFAPGEAFGTIGRFRAPDIDPAIDAAVDRALAEAELEVVEVGLPSWGNALEAALRIGLGEGYRNNGEMLAREPDGVGPRAAEAILQGREAGRFDPEARAFQAAWEVELAAALERCEALAWPTLAGFAPPLADCDSIDRICRTMEVNLAGLPALAMPVPSSGPFPASLQLVGPRGSEERLVATGAVVEAAVGPGPSA